MNRKLEAIEIIRRGLVSAARHEDAGDYAANFSKCEATFLYDEMAPLIRGEFPDKQIVQAINQELGFMCTCGACSKDLIGRLKRLWEGQQDKPKGRGECQHKDIQNVQTDLIALYCDDCKQYVKDRRIHTRRKGISDSA